MTHDLEVKGQDLDQQTYSEAAVAPSPPPAAEAVLGKSP